MTKMNSLKQLRLRQACAQTEVAVAVGCGHTSVCHAERGRVGRPAEFGGSRAVTSRALALSFELFLLDFLAGEATKDGYGVPRVDFDPSTALYPNGSAHIVDDALVAA